MRYVVAVISPNNISKSMSFLSTSNKITSANVVALLVGLSHQDEAALKTLYPNVEYRSLPNNKNYCQYQLHYGGFLDAFPEAKDSSIFMLVDPTDRCVQTNITGRDWEYIRAVANSRAVQVNGYFGPDNTVYNYTRKYKIKWLPDTTTRTCKYYNFSVIVARKNVFVKLKNGYEAACNSLYEVTNSIYAHNILLSYLIKQLRLRISFVQNHMYNEEEKQPMYYIKKNGLVQYSNNIPVVFAKDVKMPEPKPTKTVTPTTGRTSASGGYWYIAAPQVNPITAPVFPQATDPDNLPYITPMAGCNCADCVRSRAAGRRDVLATI